MHSTEVPVDPRRVAGVYWSGYWQETYTVIDISDTGLLTVYWHGDGDWISSGGPRITSHRTAWGQGRDRVIAGGRDQNGV